MSLPTKVRDALLVHRDRVVNARPAEPVQMATTLPEPFDPVVEVAYALTTQVQPDGVIRPIGVLVVVGQLYENCAAISNNAEQLTAVNALLADRFVDVARVFAPLHAKVSSVMYVAPSPEGGTTWKLEITIPRDEVT